MSSDYEQNDHVTKLSYLAVQLSLALRTLHVFIPFFCPTDQPTFTRGRAMGNETFYWDGPNKMKTTNPSKVDAICPKNV